MIVEAFFNIIFGVLDFILGLLPFFDFSVDMSAFDTMADVVKTISHLLPLRTMLTIFALILAINTFKIVVAILKTIWQILPFV